MRAFSQADRFFSELESRKLRPAYVLVGDEAFFRKRCRDAILEYLVAPDSRDGDFQFPDDLPSLRLCAGKVAHTSPDDPMARDAAKGDTEIRGVQSNSALEKRPSRR